MDHHSGHLLSNSLCRPIDLLIIDTTTEAINILSSLVIIWFWVHGTERYPKPYPKNIPTINPYGETLEPRDEPTYPNRHSPSIINNKKAVTILYIIEY